MVNWKEPEANLRLVAAIYAGNPGIKIDLTNTALAYGCGATTRSIHNQLGKCRELAKQLKDEVAKSGASQPPRGTEGDGATASRTPRTPRAQSTGMPKSGGASSRSRGGAAKGKNLETPTKAGKGIFTTGGMSMIDAIAVDSNDEEDGVISLTKSETMSVQGDMKKEEAKEEFKREVDLTTPKPLPSLQLFGEQPIFPRVDSQANGYAMNSGANSVAMATDEFSIDDIFDANH